MFATFITHIILWLVAILTGAATPQELATNEAAIRPVGGTETWAFCGVHPDAPNAAIAVRSLSIDAGIDATFGPCMPPDWTTYTTADPGQRYVDPITYLRLVSLNASVGMQTVVYDARLWSEDAAIRQSAIDFWMPYTANLAAWDMGDEFDPQYEDWNVLLRRWTIMTTVVEPATGVEPYTNHLGIDEVLDRAIIDFGHGTLSFDAYDTDLAMDLTTTFDPQCSNLVVAVNALTHAIYAPTPETIEYTMHTLDDVGADRFLVFGGAYPYLADLSPDPYFGGTSLIDQTGMPTTLAAAVLAGSY